MKTIFTKGIDEKTALAVLRCSDEDYFSRVLPVAKALREKSFGNKVIFCSITNAKSGACVEDCKFCAQSVHYKEALAPLYGLKSADQIVNDAKGAHAFGATEFSIVTSGRGVTKEKDISQIAEAIERITKETNMETCASLGLMSRAGLKKLRDAGMNHFHHNIETARSYFPNIVTTHTFDEEIRVIEDAKECGFEICCGGILGMGESLEQRVEFAFNLKEIDPHCIPLNFLNARPGTPLEGLYDLAPLDCLRIISMVRMVLPKKEIIICGGREVNLGKMQDRIFEAGANGTMLGNYLTTKGQSVDDDLEMVRRQGLTSCRPLR